MKKGQQYEGIVERTDFPCKGKVITAENETAYVKGAIEGEKICFMVSKLKNKKAEGRLISVLEKSPLENDKPQCPHFGICGGCCYQMLPYEEQLKLKERQVKRILDGAVSGFEFEEITASPRPDGYRNKMEFSFGDEEKDGELTLGLHKKGSFYDIVTVDGCSIVDEDFRTILKNVLEICRRMKLTYCHKLSHEGYLRHLVVRRAATTGEILVNLVTTSQNGGVDEEMLYEAVKNRLLEADLNGSIVGILHSVNDSPADIVRSDRTDVIHGKEFFFEEILGLFFKISTFSFFQTNSFGAELLYRKVRDFAGDTNDKVIFDLYSGTGTIAQILAPVAKKVIGIEIVEEAVEAAKENAMLNDLKNCEFIAGDVLKAIDDLTERPDIVILDPPREGINPKAIKKIALGMAAPRIVYVSCKPTSLAVDLKLFEEYGYRLKKAACVDMFPQTVHVETVVQLSRNGETRQ